MGYAAYIISFSLGWWQLTISFVTVIGAVVFGVSRLSKRRQKLFMNYLGVLFLFDIAFAEFVYYSKGSWNISWALPLQYCTLVELFAGLTLILRRQWFYELIVFVGMIGPLQALISPAFPYADMYFVYDFYFAHSAPFLVVGLCTFALGMRPRPHAWWRRVCVMVLGALGVFYFDYFIDANYMFLMEKPMLDHPFLGFGEWPNYLGIWLLVAFIWSGLINLFFWVPRKWYTVRRG